MRIDHVILGARTVAPLRDLLWDRYGFGITDGSPNPDGTASWIVPFDTPDVQYLELLVTHDERELAGSDFGRLFLERTAAGPAFLNWAVLTGDIEATAREVECVTGTDPGLFRGESVRADGQRVPWAEAAFELSWRSRVLPFFLSYGNPAARAGRVAGDVRAAGHRVRPTSVRRLVTGPAQERPWARRWPGLAGLPITIDVAADPGIVAVHVDTGEGETVVRLP
ncbi:VOC family protein [Micromonospora sp. WMMA1363]|uniref:VOC family protein n=1 Tax=Micromonospora sp. WMMA1363 TaxID=3053985 RepID=UPI00259D23D2|nr:VOC family protein [Micromonospora sp. WMMA1363]MDM4719456.1 VOC family protein [Micromonospora sp. WMMA1363]